MSEDQQMLQDMEAVMEELDTFFTKYPADSSLLEALRQIKEKVDNDIKSTQWCLEKD